MTQSHNVTYNVPLDDGKTHRISMLEARHLEALENSIRARLVAVMEKRIPEDDPERLDRIIEAESRSVDFIEVVQYVRSPAGSLEAIWLCLKDHDPDLDLETVKTKLVRGQTTATEVMRTIRDPAKTAASKKKTTKKRKKASRGGASKKGRGRGK